MRVLVIENDVGTSNALKTLFDITDMEYLVCQTADDGIEMLRVYEYNIIVLSIDIPDIPGFNVIKTIRNELKITTPILILGRNTISENIVKGFDLGGDEFLAMPFENCELIARIKAIVRRSCGYAHNVVENDMLTFNFTTRELYGCGKFIYLTATELTMMELMVLRRGRTVTYEAIKNALYLQKNKEEPESKNLTVHICSLRKKIMHACGGRDYIDTDRGEGYHLESEPLPIEKVLRRTPTKKTVISSQQPPSAL